MQAKTILITGATNGIGLATATQLAPTGARLIIAGRNETKCQQTVQQLNQLAPTASISYVVADLSDMQATLSLATQVLEQYDRLDVLLNNAGAMFETRSETAEGFERTIALNHLSMFLLTRQLQPLLTETAQSTGEARIVNVASGAHLAARAQPFLDDPQMRTRNYSGWLRYAESKLANLWFTFALARRLQDTQVTTNALHPGFVATGFGHNNESFGQTLHRWAQSLFAMRSQKGAQTPFYLATSPDVQGVTGGYFIRNKAKTSSRHARNEEAQEQWWSLTEELLRQTPTKGH